MVRWRHVIAMAGLMAAQPQIASAQTASPPPPAAAPAAPAAAAPAEKLTGLAAWDKLKGNTIEGKVAGQPVAEFFGTDGTVKYVDKDGLSTGTWTVQNDRVCFDFPEEDDRSCSTFEVTGSTGVSVDDDKETIRFTVLTGNSKGL